MLYSLFIGAIIGWLAGEIMKSKGSLLRNIVIGILGSFVGHTLFSFIGLGAHNIIGDILISTAGSCLLIIVARKLA